VGTVGGAAVPMVLPTTLPGEWGGSHRGSSDPTPRSPLSHYIDGSFGPIATSPGAAAPVMQQQRKASPPPPLLHMAIAWPPYQDVPGLLWNDGAVQQHDHLLVGDTSHC